MRFVTVTLPLFFLIGQASPVAGDSLKGPATAGESASQSAKSASSIRVDVRMALVPVTVLDGNGRNVTGLQRENFRVIDGREPQAIASFSREDQPISVGLIFDCSRSMMDKFAVARTAPVELFRQLNDQDETFLITVSDAAELRRSFTGNFGDVRDALLFTRPTGSTSLLDGIYLGLAEMKKAHNPRKALIVVSDGGDNNSRYTMRELRKIAQESDTQIFSIGLHANPQAPEETEGPELLDGLGRASGGIQYVVRQPSEIAQAMAKIGTTLHNEYVLGYYPPASAQSGKYRTITVELRVPEGLPALHIYSRSGYYAP